MSHHDYSTPSNRSAAINNAVFNHYISVVNEIEQDLPVVRDGYLSHRTPSQVARQSQANHGIVECEAGIREPPYSKADLQRITPFLKAKGLKETHEYRKELAKTAGVDPPLMALLDDMGRALIRLDEIGG